MQDESCDCGCDQGISRRDMLTVLGAAAVTLPMLGGSASAQTTSAPAVGWVKTVKVVDLPAKGADPVGAQPFFLSHVDNQVFAVSTRCTHKGCNLKPVKGAADMTCPCHKAVFDVTGKNTKGPRGSEPSLDPLARYALRLDADGVIEVDTSKKITADAPEATLKIGA